MLIEHDGSRPRVDATAYIAPNAVVSGDVAIGPNYSVLFGAVITAEGGAVEIEADCVVMEHAVIRGTPRHPTRLGSRVLVGPHAHLTGCVIADDVFLATGVAVFNGSEIGPRSEVRINAVVHVGSVVPAETTVPIGWVAVGKPARVFPTHAHDKIWEIQRELDFPGTVFGVSRDVSTGETTRRSMRRRCARGIPRTSSSSHHVHQVSVGGWPRMSGRKNRTAPSSPSSIDASASSCSILIT